MIKSTTSFAIELPIHCLLEMICKWQAVCRPDYTLMFDAVTTGSILWDAMQIACYIAHAIGVMHIHVCTSHAMMHASAGTPKPCTHVHVVTGRSLNVPLML